MASAWELQREAGQSNVTGDGGVCSCCSTAAPADDGEVKVDGVVDRTATALPADSAASYGSIVTGK